MRSGAPSSVKLARLPIAKTIGSLCLTAAVLSACTLAPAYERPALPVAGTWPVGGPDETSGAPIGWKALFLDPKLQATIALALDNNRDLRVAALNITRARAQYGISRANLLPSADATASAARGRSVGVTNDNYSADLGLSWEIDLFGRIRSLNKAALETFFATQENRDAVEISLIGDVARAWLDLAADQDALRLAQQTLKLRQDALDIAGGRARIGVISDLDIAQARTAYETARQTLAQAETAVDQDSNALTLLVGTAPGPDLLPDGLKPGQVADSLPVGLPSQVLSGRPDILAAEHQLKSANANIGAARAALFPTIRLTGAAGGASHDLGTLFSSGSGTWSFGAGLTAPIFAGGANINGVRAATATRDIAVAQYQAAIQSAFRDVSNALAVRARIDERVDAQTKATDAAALALKLSQARYDAGTDSYLTLLDAERTLYAAQQSLIDLQLLRANNLATLYQAVAGDNSLR
ncbi:MAG: efflux transporter outer membrane subunit [Asticcacaulis sp.]